MLAASFIVGRLRYYRGPQSAGRIPGIMKRRSSPSNGACWIMAALFGAIFAIMVIKESHDGLAQWSLNIQDSMNRDVRPETGPFVFFMTLGAGIAFSLIARLFALLGAVYELYVLRRAKQAEKDARPNCNVARDEKQPDWPRPPVVLVKPSRGGRRGVG